MKVELDKISYQINKEGIADAFLQFTDKDGKADIAVVSPSEGSSISISSIIEINSDMLTRILTDVSLRDIIVNISAASYLAGARLPTTVNNEDISTVNSHSFSFDDVKNDVPPISENDLFPGDPRISNLFKKSPIPVKKHESDKGRSLKKEKSTKELTGLE